jgi:uncharacterized phage protein (TIGR02218 family)
MRTPSWEQSPGALAALLNSGVPLERADCYTVTLAGGQVLRWSGSDVAVTFGGNTYALGPGITRNRLRWVVGVEVSTLDMTLSDNVGTQIAGRGLMAFIRARGFYGARVLLQRAFWAFGDTAPRGALLWFAGAVADCRVDRDTAQLTINSDIERLNVQVPRDVYQPGCLNSLYDGLCQVSRAAFTVTGLATSATSAGRTTFSHALVQYAGWFDLGVVTMTSGANEGQSRTVKQHTYGELVVLQPWGFPVAIGDTFSISAGCNKTQATCSSNLCILARFRGMPYFPLS